MKQSIDSLSKRITLCVILLLTLATVIWAFCGTMQIREEVSGILVKSGRIIHIYAAEDGVLLDVSAETGDYVESSQVIARIDQSRLVEEINSMLEEGYPALEITLARAELLRKSRILTYDSGRILDVFVHNGDYLYQGTKIVTLSKETADKQNLECILYVPMAKVKNMRKGMRVSIFPDFADQDEYGNMTGVIAGIGEFPVTFQEIYDKVGNEDMAYGLLGEGTSFAVSVHLETSEESVTGYKWTTSLGPSRKIGSLALCDAAVLIKEMRPLDVFFIPASR